MKKGDSVRETFLMSQRTIRRYDIQPISKAQREEEKALGDVLAWIEAKGLGPYKKRER